MTHRSGEARTEPVAVSGPPTAPAGRSARGRDVLGYLVILVLASAASVSYLGRGLLEASTSTWRGNPGDPEQIMWFLAATARAVSTAHSPFLNNLALYPDGVNMMWNGSIIAPGVLVTPITLVFGPVVSYNALLVTGPIATSLTAYFAFRRYVATRIAAGVGALTFAFCPFVLIHSFGHLHIVLLALVPLIIVALDEIVIRQRFAPVITGAALGFLVACQLLTSEEVLAITALLGGAGLVLLMLFRPREIGPRTPHVLRAGAAALVTFAILSAYPLYVQVRGPRRAPGAHDTSVYVTDAMNFIRPVLQLFGTNSHLNQNLPYTGNAAEWTGYLGIPLLLVIMITLVWVARRRRLVVVIPLLLLVIFAVCSLGPKLHVNGHDTGVPMPWAIADKVPLVNNVLADRLSLAVAFAAALLLAVFVDEIVQSRVLAVRLGGALLTALVGLSLVPNGMHSTTVTTPSFFSSAALDRYVPKGSVVLIAPYIFGPAAEHPMLWQANTGMRFEMVDGWLIVPGQHYGTRHILATTLEKLQARPVQLTPSLRSQFVGELNARQVANVLVAPMPNRDRVIAFFSQLFGHSSDVQSGGVDLWHVTASG